MRILSSAVSGPVANLDQKQVRYALDEPVSGNAAEAIGETALNAELQWLQKPGDEQVYCEQHYNKRDLTSLDPEVKEQ